MAELRTCRGCGCDDLAACPGGCSWVLLDMRLNRSGRYRPAPTGICSACAEEVEYNPRFLAEMGFVEEPEPMVLLPGSRHGR